MEFRFRLEARAKLKVEESAVSDCGSPGRPFLPEFPRPVLACFGLFGFSPSLVVIFAALSLHPKIPFLADKYRDRSGDFGAGKIVVIAAD